MKTVDAFSWLVPAIILIVVGCSGNIPESANSRATAFDAWLSAARPAFANYNDIVKTIIKDGHSNGQEIEARILAEAEESLGSIVDDYYCQNQVIGHGIITETACTGSRTLSVGDEHILIQVDWALKNPERWHADLNLNTPVRVKCQDIQSSVENRRVKNNFAELVTCRSQVGDELVLAFTSNDITIASLSAGFTQAYPGYLSELIKTVEPSSQ